MTFEELALAIHSALLDSIGSGVLTLDPGVVPETVRAERPRNRDHGDWATNITMQLAKRAGLAPRAFAEILAGALRLVEGIDSIEITDFGFVDIRLGTAPAGEFARTTAQTTDSCGLGSSLAGASINLEYVSASPTGPVHLGGARWAAVGDSLAHLMTASGAGVTCGYYFSDHGSQIDRFAKLLYAYAMGREAPGDEYGGQYIADIAEKVHHDALQAGETDLITLPENEAVEAFRARGVEPTFDEIKEHLRDFRSELGVFFHEDSLHESGVVAHAIDTLREHGKVFDRDDAVRLHTTSYGDDKDRILIRSGGQATYFAGNVAYYLDKRNRGADSAIYLLGADHHGYIGRIMAMYQAFGDTPGASMQILIGQMANLLKNDAPVRMSKRAGTIVTLNDLVGVVGADAARYTLVRVSIGSSLGIDLGLLTPHTSENPVYYVQYAYAKTRNVTRDAIEHGVSRDAGFDPTALGTPADAELLEVLTSFPAQIAQAAELREPHRLARYLGRLASVYHA